MTSPFLKSSNRAGEGAINLSVLPPSTPVLQTLSFQYPLKLIAPSPIDLANNDSPLEGTANSVLTSSIVHSVFVLTYGGGLLPGDHISLRVNLASGTRLILLTQGSTKIFKTNPSAANHVNASQVSAMSSQRMIIHVEDDAALCYLPDPVQPFANSAFEQKQIYKMLGAGKGSICVCDWVCEGRRARGENWSFERYTSCNEIWTYRRHDPVRKLQDLDRLMLRDNVILDGRDSNDTATSTKTNNTGVFGTLMLRGPLFKALGQYFLDEFRLLPRIGAKQWDTDHKGGDHEQDGPEDERAVRQGQEVEDDLLWTAAASRGNVIVKFGARSVDGARSWLRSMLVSEGTIQREFGERALLCLR
ncbi:MAG: hypothetical protein M1820_003314 [Bogoriella megaspora]|nr:MAG: hypothetical protein M1820_003314 [Bogoriella megaspora]